MAYEQFYCNPQSFDDPILKKLDIRLNRKSLINFKLLTIGRGSKFNGVLHIKGGKVHIGQFIAGGYDIRMIANNHNTQLVNMQLTLQKAVMTGAESPPKASVAGKITVGNACWIGDNCTILKNVTIGDGCVIGSNSVVTKDVPPYAIVAGVPAKVIKFRFSPVVREQLLDIAWWNWEYEKIIANKRFFSLEIQPNQELDLYPLIDD